MLFSPINPALALPDAHAPALKLSTTLALPPSDGQGAGAVMSARADEPAGEFPGLVLARTLRTLDASSGPTTVTRANEVILTSAPLVGAIGAVSGAVPGLVGDGAAPNPELPADRRDPARRVGNSRREPIILAQAPGGPTRGSSPAQNASPADVGLTGRTGFRFDLAPVRWGGTLSEIFSYGTIGDTKRTLHTQAAYIRGASYIWQPWFAQVGATLGFATSGQTTSTSGAASTSESTTRSNSITGGGSLSLFPVSRFPFSASYDVSDNRTSGEIVSSDQRTTRLGLRQSYSPAKSQMQLIGSYDRSTVESDFFGRDTVNALSGSMSMPFREHHKLNFNADYTSNQPRTNQAGTKFTTLSARHNYQPSSLMSLDTFSTYSRTNIDIDTPTVGRLVADTQSFQVSSNGFWRPHEESPLNVSGGVRYFNTSSSTLDTSADFQSFGANLFAGYAYSRNVNFSGGLGVTQAVFAGRSQVITTQNATASYNADPKMMWDGVYSWNAATGVNNQTGAAEGNQASVNAQIGHNFFREVYRDERSFVSMNLGQFAGVFTGGVAGGSQSLSHRGGLSWSLRQSDNLLMSFSASVSDSRNFGNIESESQQISLQANGNLLLSRYSTFGANMFIYGTRQTGFRGPLDPVQSEPGWDWGANGSMQYQHSRAFGVPRLRYSAQFIANTYLQSSRILGNVNAPVDQATYSFDQRLIYTIGRLDLLGSFRIDKLQGRNNAILFLRVNRNFGAF